MIRSVCTFWPGGLDFDGSAPFGAERKDSNFVTAEKSFAIAPLSITLIPCLSYQHASNRAYVDFRHRNSLAR